MSAAALPVVSPRFTAQQVDQFVAALTSIDPAQIVADFKAGDVGAEVGDVLLVADVVAGDVGYVVPEAAMAERWIALARALLPVLIPAAEYANAHLPPPHRLQPDEYEAWGDHVFKR